MTYLEYVDVASRIGIMRSEIDLWILDKGHLLAPRRRAVMQDIANLLGEADVAIFTLQRRIDALKSELAMRDADLKVARRNLDHLMDSLL